MFRLVTTSSTLDDWRFGVAALHRDIVVDEVHLANIRHWGSAGW